MKYQVIVTPQAQAGISISFHYIFEHAPLNAAKWIRELYARIETLENFPERCGYARERDYFEEELRQLVFKSHRIVFQVNQSTATVYVLHVRHSSRRPIGESENED